MMQLFVFALCLVFLVILVPMAFVTYALFWYETANSDYREALEKKSRGKSGRWILRGILSSFLSVALILCFFPLGFWRKLWRPDSPAPSNSAPPVVLIHGLYHNASAWILFGRWLKRAGFTQVYGFNYSSWTQTFEEIVEELDRFVAGVSRDFPGKPVLLVGHSLGGLLGRALVQRRPDAPQTIGGLVTLGSPHQGSKLAVLGVGRLAQSLGYRGPLIVRLEQTSTGAPVPSLAIYSPVDNMVLPHQALQCPVPGWEHAEPYPTSHVQMLFHRPTADQVVDYLKRVGATSQETSAKPAGVTTGL